MRIYIYIYMYISIYIYTHLSIITSIVMLLHNSRRRVQP